MATYKKRGYKPKNKAEEKQAEEMQSTTAEVFNTLDETASRSEQWIEKNSKPLFYGLIAVAGLILAFWAYNQYVVEPTEVEASNELSFPRKYYDLSTTAKSTEVDSLLNLGLQGADGKYGFLDIATTYSGTKAGNLANYYAGISYLKMKNYKNAIEYLSKFKSDDKSVTPIALGAIGDAFADLEQYNDAIEYYEKAAKTDNSYTSPLFLFKAGQIALSQKEYSKAEGLFTQIKKDYPKSDQAKDVEKFIYAAKYAQ